MLFLPVSGIVISRVAKKLKSALRGKEELGSLSNILEETLSGMKIIKAFGPNLISSLATKLETKSTLRAMRKMYQKEEYMSSPLSEVISLTVMAILLGYGGKIVLAGDTGLTGDWFIGYLVVFSQIIPPARALSDGGLELARAWRL